MWFRQADFSQVTSYEYCFVKNSFLFFAMSLIFPGLFPPTLTFVAHVRSTLGGGLVLHDYMFTQDNEQAIILLDLKFLGCGCLFSLLGLFKLLFQRQKQAKTFINLQLGKACLMPFCRNAVNVSISRFRSPVSPSVFSIVISFLPPTTPLNTKAQGSAGQASSLCLGSVGALRVSPSSSACPCFSEFRSFLDLGCTPNHLLCLRDLCILKHPLVIFSRGSEEGDDEHGELICKITEITTLFTEVSTAAVDQLRNACLKSQMIVCD